MVHSALARGFRQSGFSDLWMIITPEDALMYGYLSTLWIPLTIEDAGSGVNIYFILSLILYTYTVRGGMKRYS